MGNVGLPPNCRTPGYPSAILNTGHLSGQLEWMNVWPVTTGDFRLGNDGYVGGTRRIASAAERQRLSSKL